MSDGEPSTIQLVHGLAELRQRILELDKETEANKRQQAEQALAKAHDELEARVAERTADLRRVNQQLQIEIAHRKEMEHALTGIVEATTSKIGEDFLRSLTGHLATLLDVRYAFIAELTDNSGKALRTVTFWKEHAFTDNFQFVITGTPCERILQDKQPLFYAEDVQIHFPDDPWLKEARVTSYLAVPFFEASGALVGLMGVMHDQPFKTGPMAESILRLFATRAGVELERKRTEAQQTRLAIALESAGEAVMIVDADGTIRYVNPAFEHITGYTAEEAVGQSPQLLKSGKQDPTIYRELRATLKQEKVWRGSFINKKKDGTLFNTETTVAPVRVASHEGIGRVAVMRDITANLRLEEQLRQAQKLQAIGTLAGGVAHDFNNILSAILGYTELALDDAESGSVLWQNLQEVLTAGERAKALVQQILTFSRQQDNAERQPIQLHRLVEEVLKLIRASLPTTLAIRLHLDTTSSTVLADPTQMHQVLMNLCTNAGHAMRDNGGTLEVCVRSVEVSADFAAGHPELTPGDYVCVTVQDTGHGMKPDVLERIFEPFFTTKAVGEGTGMGLAVAHGIVTSHGGAITVRSTVGEGTTFAIYLPHIQDDLTPTGAPEPPTPHGTGRILFVDDEEMLARWGQTVLERLGYEVVMKTSSREALEAFRSEPQRFDLIVMDQTMPEMTGEALLHQLRQLRANIPIILCTGFSHVMTAEKAQALGIQTFLMKPLKGSDLAIAIQQALQPHPAESDARSCLAGC